MAYKLLTGCFAGCVCEEVTILDVDFSRLDDDLQLRIRDWAETEVGSKYVLVNGGDDFAYKGSGDAPLSMNSIKEDYELSWDSEESDEAVNLVPVSEW